MIKRWYEKFTVSDFGQYDHDNYRRFTLKETLIIFSVVLIPTFIILTILLDDFP